jgi:hypothetical protein
VSKTHLLELSKDGFWRGAGLQPATLAALRTRHALAVRVKATRIFEGKAAIVPGPELPWRLEPEEQATMMMRVAEVTVLERHVTGPEHEVTVAELEHQTALGEVPELSRLGVWHMSELGCKTTVAEVPEVP